MADITLADYTGYIFREIIKSREMADAYARQVAEAYAKDPVLQFFSVPRFKVPKMTLTIPVLISGARFSEVIVFKMTEKAFVAYVLGRVKDVISTLKIKGGGGVFKVADVPIGPVKPVLVGAAPPVNKAGETAATLDQLALALHQALRDNPDPSQPATIVRDGWQRIFEQALTERGLVELYKKLNPNDEQFNQSLADVLQVVKNNTVVDSTTIQSLLINPETNIVKNGSSDTSVFTINAELLEEGFFIRTVKDDTTGETRPVVEFD